MSMPGFGLVSTNPNHLRQTVAAFCALLNRWPVVSGIILHWRVGLDDVCQRVKSLTGIHL